MKAKTIKNGKNGNMHLFIFALMLILAGCSMNLVGHYEDAGDDAARDEIDQLEIDVHPDSPCPAGETLCGTECVDLSSDVDHCGACGNACEEDEVCFDGSCDSECGGGLTNCSGSCVDTDSDEHHCGRCDNECPTPPNAEPVCEGGECGYECLPGWSDINGRPEDGCEEECEFTSPDEQCNGIDDNCDGQVDEGFDCARGEEVACTTTCGSTGLGTCTDDCRLPAAEACTPPEETCNGLDDDCDGAADNGFACVMGTEVECTTICGTPGTGTCTSACEIPTGSECSAGDEVCNGEDDNCNGEADETFPCVSGAETECTTTCGSTGTGTCGVDCSLPPPAECVPPVEICNGLDDDCDGACDNGFDCCAGESGSCTTSCGSTGTVACTSSCVWGSCTPPAETCNGLDDDCDGACDNGFDCCAGTSQSCTTSCGSTGLMICSSSCGWGGCIPPAETCNGLDDDCDGACDNGFSCCSGTTRPCSIGNCDGTETCDGSCEWGGCSLGAPPANDTCDSPTNLLSGGTFTGTTCVASNDYTAGCGNSAQSPDVVYQLDLSQRSMVVVDTCTGTTWNTVVHLRGDGCAGGYEVACSNDACGEQSRIEVAVDAGTYYVIVDGFGTGNSGPFTLNVLVTPLTRPVNDTCSGAIDISAGGAFSGDTTGATTDPDAACAGYHRSGVWYTFSLSRREVVYFDTQDGETWDSVITVRSGSCTGTEVLCDDDGCGNYRSQVAGVLGAGTYYVLVSGYYMSSSGPFTLTYEHSRCPGARALNSGSNNGNTGGQGNDTFGTCGGGGCPDIPYYFTQCPGSSSVVMSLCDGRSWDSAIYLKSGGAGTCGSTQVGCNDDGCGGSSVRSWLRRTLTGPGLFFIIVDGYDGGSSGWYTLNASF